MKHVLIALAALLGVVGAWGTRLAWRAHKQIVSLNVRNAPLADVLRKIEWQTWKKIHAEKGLDARITLTLKDKPLAYVLDRVAEQAGAQWSTLHAVYDSRRALNKLKSALRGDGKLEPAGWTRIAPGPLTFEEPAAEAPTDAALSGAHPQMQQRPFTVGPGKVVTATEDVVAPGPAGVDGANGNGPRKAIQRPPMVFRGMKMRAPLGEKDIEEMWTPEEVVIETSLKGHLPGENNYAPTAQAAAEIAKSVKSHWTTYLAFRKSPFGIGLRPPMLTRSRNSPGKSPAGSQKEIAESKMGDLENRPFPPDLEEEANRTRNDHFARLTPEQRVQRERQRGAMKEQMAQTQTKN